MLNTEINPREYLVLIVDDLPKNLQVLGNILANAGYRIAVATSGEQSLKILEKKTPDLVLLDVMMPEMDGFDVCKEIRNQERFDNLPVLFVSAKSDTESKVQGFEIGAADYITKPFQAAEILARVKTQIKLKQAIKTITGYNSRLEQLLEERTQDLIKSERMAAFSLFSQGIVHNLKNPLTSISGGAQLIAMGSERFENVSKQVDPETRKYVNLVTKHADIIGSAVQKMMAMINSLMAKSRSDKSDSLEVININEVICLEISFLSANLQFKNEARKEIQLADHPLFVEIVPAELSQIFQNLVQNALDAMHSQEDACIVIQSGENDDEVWFSISDNGPGIPDDIKARIYDPFFTTKQKTNYNGNHNTGNDGDSPTGTGLGLHICSQMIRAYGGRIKVQTAPQQGTTFTVCLPKCFQPAMLSTP